MQDLARRLALLVLSTALGWRPTSRRMAAPRIVMSALSPPRHVVMKFGGSSVANAERVSHVAELIASQMAEEGTLPAVVLSAMGKTTNCIIAAGERALEGRVDVSEIRSLHLESLAALELPISTGAEVRGLLRDLESLLDGVSMVRELTPRTKDLIVSFGERMSCRVLAATLSKIGVPAVPCDAWTLGVRTKGMFGDSVVDEACYPEVARSISDLFSQGQVPIVTGFIGHDADGRVATLGRGGSDLTATVLGAAFGFDEVQVWKDVDGMMTADPRVVRAALPVPFVTYEEAAELAYFGAQVLHPISMQPALRAGVPVRVKNSYNPTHCGTLIAEEATIKERRSVAPLVTAITSKRHVTVIDVVSLRMLGSHGFLARVFDVLARDRVSVDVVATSEVSVSLSLDEEQSLSPAALEELSEIAQVELKHDRSIVSFVGDGSRSTELIAQVFAVLAANDLRVEMISQGASKVNVAIVVQDDQAELALNLIHGCFFGAPLPATCGGLAVGELAPGLNASAVAA
ncbi:hypothetical protein CTAYLR_006005 [Chrysophaeum taylorii]|uniref:Aspartokinase n=1 Tax=Chrysophaeum taylorii TaxID=2483200 RepID=A0AAD7U6T2_9STRA|nr:hypothetical protein CTAYLR_006005 [Chrysophaeum taylorii]